MSVSSGAVGVGSRMLGWLQGVAASRMEARAERILVVAGVVIRGTFVLQILVAMLPEGAMAQHQRWFYLLSALMVSESVTVAACLLRRGRYVTRIAVVDLVFVALLVGVEPLCVMPSDVVGTWASWGYAAAFASVVPAAIGVRSWRLVFAGAIGMLAVYLVGTLPLVVSENARVTALTNALSILGISMACRLAGGFVRLMGQEADRARDRERVILHNSGPLLHMLSQDIPDPLLRESAQGAAARGARQIRAVLSDGAVGRLHNARGQHYLKGLVDGVCQEFGDLPLTANLELLGSTAVSPDVADVVAEAVRTLLWNVRRHAAATAVTVHGDCDSRGVWTVTVTDNGVGFDPDTTASGFGLGVQAGSTVRAAGLTVVVDSAPDEGTRVELRPERSVGRVKHG